MNRQYSQDFWCSAGKEKWLGCREEWSDEDWWERSHEKGGTEWGMRTTVKEMRRELSRRRGRKGKKGKGDESLGFPPFNISPAILHRISLSCNLPYFSFSSQPLAQALLPSGGLPSNRIAWSPRVVRHIAAWSFRGVYTFLAGIEIFRKM